MRFYLAPFLLLPGVVFVSNHAVAQKPPTEVSAQAVLDDISARGGKVVLWEAWDRDMLGEFCSGISSASPKWLRVAVLLRPFSDAGASESLDMCVGYALPKAPSRVLPLATQGYSLYDICNPGFIEPELGVERRHYEAAERALRKKLPANLEPARKQCLAIVRSVLQEIRSRGE